MAPRQRPGLSKQDYQTPPEYIKALEDRLQDELSFDLAASASNTVAPRYYDEYDDSLIQSWNEWYGWLYCNPPYSAIGPWVQKAWFEAQLGAQVAMLVPASTGSNWWRDWVDGKAHVLLMNGRVQFVGADGPYPKDTVTLLYTPYVHGGYEVWSWK